MLSALRVQIPWLKHVEWHEELGSTQDRARELVQAGTLPAPFLIGSDLQTGGRGRGKHRWWTGKAFVFLAQLLSPSRGRALLLVPLLVALTTHQSCRPLSPLLPLAFAV